MNQCQRCRGFVPENVVRCPNCRSTSKWWAFPLSVLGAGAATVTLSACYGAPCASRMPDGTLSYGNARCGYDCNEELPDGGDKTKDPDWQYWCEPVHRDGGSDGGHDGGSDAGH